MPRTRTIAQKLEMPRRTVLKGGAATAASGLTVLSVAGPAQAFPGHVDQSVVIPWLDVVPPVPPQLVKNLAHPLVWEDIEYLTPNDKFFTVKHYDVPQLSRTDWRLGVNGLVARPRNLSLADLRALPRRVVTFALECSGNGDATPNQIGLVGNARWAGASLAQILKGARPLDEGIEVIFWGADQGEVTIRDNSGIFSGGQTGQVAPDDTGGLDLTITERFARSMSLADAMSSSNLLCYEMNGVPLPADHGAPVRLIAPDWYGVANVKWLTRIEITSSRFQGKFMARDYVSIREQKRGGRTHWTFTSVTHERLKSAPAKVTRRGGGYTVLGAAWGAPIAKVEVRIDDGPWRPTKLARIPAGRAAWKFWTLSWPDPAPGEHTITSRAYDTDGNVQPTPVDPYLTSKRTFWENNGHMTRRVLIP
jgi:DMSO/TMAO reductase YedYZ molybdopterin-dependent catalytic subunit